MTSPTVEAVEAVLAAVRPAGSHDVLTLSVPDGDAWERARPGQLLVEPVDPAHGRVLARPRWLAGCTRDVLHGTTVDLVVPAAQDERDHPRTLRLLGPLGRGFALPSPPVPALLVGHGEDAVPLRWLAELLRRRGAPVDLVLVATDPDGHLDPAGLRRTARSVVLAGADAWAQAVRDGLARGDHGVVYGCGPAPVMTELAALAAAAGRASRLAPLSLGGIVCGTGQCGTCELEAGRGAGRRPCTDGPVLPGELLVPGLGADGGGR